MSQDHGPDDDRDDALSLSPEDRGRLLHIADFETSQPGRILRQMRDYWEGLRKDGTIPARADVEPRGIRGALNHAFILERIAPGTARFRLAGSHLIETMGMEVRGMPICSLLHTGSRGRFSDVLESVFCAPQIAELGLNSPASYGRPAMAGQLLLLPLRSDLGDVTRALGCFVVEGEIGQAPRRFDLTSEKLVPVQAGAKVMAPSASLVPVGEISGRWRATTPRTESPAPTPLPGATPEQRRAAFRIVSDNPR
ncbi:PAS domain-containing protein [Paracoccus broussonetiae]|uniref:PAS domain-containing protein n=1 Tax=Paracoccus broussonetiae subsp. drimophilus TaxID=3373869 RepID=A0ABW7LPJ1_9RHOB